MYNFSCCKCGHDRMIVKDWRFSHITSKNEPWCFCPVCRHKTFAKEHRNKDQAVGEMTWKYIDRMCDPTPEDSAEKILKEFVDEWHNLVQEE